MAAKDWDSRDMLPVVERCKREILADIAAGHVPQDIGSFAELHDYADANAYGGPFEDFDWTVAAMNFWDRVQKAVDKWLKDGRVG